MTRKDFALIAQIIRALPLSIEQRRAIAVRFALALFEAYPNFDTAKFMSAATGDPA
jgi:hypothetical protein